MKMICHELPYRFLLSLLLTLVFLPNLSSSQYDDSPRNIETHYSGPSFAPAPAPSPAPAPYKFPDSPPPPEPGSSSPRKKAIITAVGVTAASALVAAALVFLLVSRLSKSRRSQNGTSGGSDSSSRAALKAVSATTRSRPEETSVKVDEEGLDVVYWIELNKKFSTSASRVHPHPGPTRITPPHQQSALTLPSSGDQVDVSRGHSQYSGDIVEAMFGTLASNRGKSEKIFLLDPLKSREMSAVLRSLGVPRDNLIDALLQGKGLTAETLERLTSTAPTSDEESRILAFSGDPAMLADAESFLYTLLKAFPSAFTQMHWSLSFESDVLVRVKEPLRALESACDELRSRESFLKLLQAIHNAAARLCAPANRETKAAFNLNTLGKLSDYRSTDGKTTLLHFVIHQVVRNEGRRCVLGRSKSVSRHSAKEDKERDFLMLGLPIVGGLSSEFANAKMAANIDNDALNSALASLVNRIKEARQQTSGGVSGGGYLESAELDAKAAQLEHKRVMNLVRRTTQYYQAGDSSNHENPLQLFVIVRDFLSRIDQACVEIARSLQQNPGSGSDSSHPDVLRTRVNFHRLPPDFFSDTSTTSLGDDS